MHCAYLFLAVNARGALCLRTFLDDNYIMPEINQLIAARVAVVAFPGRPCINPIALPVSSTG